MKLSSIPTLVLGTLFSLALTQTVNAVITSPLPSEKSSSHVTPAGWVYQPDWVPGYYYEPVPDFYYYEPVPEYYYYEPVPYFAQPGLSFNLSL